MPAGGMRSRGDRRRWWVSVRWWLLGIVVWWSRLGAWLCIYSLGWLGLVALAIYGPLLLGLGANAVAGLSLTWAATTIGGLWAGRSPASGPKQSGSGMRMVAQAAPYVFVV